MSVDHYENFPVASWLCPPALRAPITAIYHYARVADDIADEGDAPAAHRLEQLQRYRQALQRCLDGQPAAVADWPQVFGPLQQAIFSHRLPTQPLHDLLDAFTQDVAQPLYPDRATLLDYCRRSANPVGRLLLHLYRIDDAQALQQSDAICTALQLINFWQDCSVDHGRGRCYLPMEDARRAGLDIDLLRSPTGLRSLDDTPHSQALLAELVAWSRGVMLQGWNLPLSVPGRAGWELRLVVQGGLCIADKIQAMAYRTLRRRPRLRAMDAPLLLARALCMRRRPDALPLHTPERERP